MSNLAGKRVLLIAPKFFGYEKKIADKIKEFGADVDLYDERANPTTLDKIFIRMHFLFPVNRKINKYYSNIIKNDKEYDYVVFINPETVNIALLKKMKLKFSNAIFILYMWDSLQNKPHTQKLISFFDKKFSFNKDDCKLYGMIFRPLFFIDDYNVDKVNSATEIKYDISFVGTIHSDRYFILKEIKNWAEGIKLKTYFFMYFPSKILYYKYKINNPGKHIDKNDFSYIPKKSDDIKNILLSSRTVIDIQHPKQTGLTMRTIETLGLDKKLITTNEDIKNYDFYNPKNILVIDRNNPAVDENFIKTPYEKIVPEIKNRYSLAGFIEELFRAI